MFVMQNKYRQIFVLDAIGISRDTTKYLVVMEMFFCGYYHIVYGDHIGHFCIVYEGYNTLKNCMLAGRY